MPSPVGTKTQVKPMLDGRRCTARKRKIELIGDKMYERLLDKTISPTFDDLIAYSAESGVLWLELDKYLTDIISAQRQIRFPYGNKYGWSCVYRLKNKHICDAFAEKGSFALHFNISNQQINFLHLELIFFNIQIQNIN